MLFCSVYQEVFGHFLTIPDHFGTFPKNFKDIGGLPKFSKVFHFPLLLRNNAVILRFSAGTTLQFDRKHLTGKTKIFEGQGKVRDFLKTKGKCLTLSKSVKVLKFSARL